MRRRPGAANTTGRAGPGRRPGRADAGRRRHVPCGRAAGQAGRAERWPGAARWPRAGDQGILGRGGAGEGAAGAGATRRDGCASRAGRWRWRRCDCHSGDVQRARASKLEGGQWRPSGGEVRSPSGGPSGQPRRQCGWRPASLGRIAAAAAARQARARRDALVASAGQAASGGRAGHGSMRRSCAMTNSVPGLGWPEESATPAAQPGIRGERGRGRGGLAGRAGAKRARSWNTPSWSCCGDTGATGSVCAPRGPVGSRLAERLDAGDRAKWRIAGRGQRSRGGTPSRPRLSGENEHLDSPVAMVA